MLSILVQHHNNVLQRKLIEFKKNPSQGKEYSQQLVPFIFFLLFLKFVNVPVRDGIIDLNQIMKHYTLYSKTHFLALHSIMYHLQVMWTEVEESEKSSFLSCTVLL